MNSQALLKGTNVVLFNITEATLVRWYKNTTRRDEIKQLMQGLSTPLATMSTASETLPPPVKHPSTPLSCPPEPHSFSEPEDTTGQVRVRKTSLPPSLSAAKSSTARASEAYSSSPIALRTFDVRLQNQANVLSEAILGIKIFPLYTPPPQYTFWGCVPLPTIRDDV